MIRESRMWSRRTCLLSWRALIILTTSYTHNWLWDVRIRRDIKLHARARKMRKIYVGTREFYFCAQWQLVRYNWGSNLSCNTTTEKEAFEFQFFLIISSFSSLWRFWVSDRKFIIYAEDLLNIQHQRKGRSF